MKDIYPAVDNIIRYVLFELVNWKMDYICGQVVDKPPGCVLLLARDIGYACVLYKLRKLGI